MDATWHAGPRGTAAGAHSMSGWRLGGADVWQGHASRRGRPGGTTWHCERAGRFVGPAYSIRAVTHLRYVAPPFILALSLFFFHVGLCSREI